jgi:hypothetical protein
LNTRCNFSERLSNMFGRAGTPRVREDSRRL